MKRILYTLILSIFVLLPAKAQLTFLPRTAPETVGLASSDVKAFVDEMMTLPVTDMHGLMVLRNGKVIAEKYNEPFAAKYSHTLYSCSKTFTGAAVGMVIGDSLLTLEAHLVDFFPEALPDSVSENLAAITVRDLLTMQSGFPVDTQMRTRYNDWIHQYLIKDVTYTPGTHFAYDSIDSYLLAAIVQKVTGMKLIDFLRQRLFKPMGITRVEWEESPEGISCGGWGLYLQLEAMAKFGQLLLQRGEWNGMQLIPAEWVDEMMKEQAASGTNYGYHIWMSKYPGMVRCDGAYGQYIMIVPDRQMVVAFTQCIHSDGSIESDRVWELSRKATEQAMTPGKEYRQLQLATYSLPVTKGKALSRTITTPHSISLGNNDLGWKNVILELGRDQRKKSPTLTLHVTDRAGKTYDIVCGHQQWITGPIGGTPLNFRPFRGQFSNLPRPFYVGASYGWTSDTDLYVRLHYVNWYASCRLHFKFVDGNVQVRILGSVTEKTLLLQSTLEPSPKFKL